MRVQYWTNRPPKRRYFRRRPLGARWRTWRAAGLPWSVRVMWAAEDMWQAHRRACWLAVAVAWAVLIYGAVTVMEVVVHGA